jgi:predicted phosphate transport protein (TIGR00153 family)
MKGARTILRFFIKQYGFFDLFDEQVSYAVEASRFFKEVVTHDRVSEETLSRMAQIEHQGDNAAHAIIEHLNRTFITPFDREDIHALAMGLDDITDMIHNIVRRLAVYDITGVHENLVEFAAVIDQSVWAVATAVEGLRHIKNVRAVFDACVEVNRLENVGDTMRDKVLGELFATAKDPIVVLKWKDVYQDAETVLDVCEDVVHVVDSIMVKQA